MSIRIYALSKVWNVDSQLILDAVKSLGIEGKGSSLAGLTEEEVIQTKKVLYNTETPSLVKQGHKAAIPQKNVLSKPVQSQSEPKKKEVSRGFTIIDRYDSRQPTTLAQRLVIERFGGWVF